MIPKTIHYCWFGGNPIPDEYEAYIDSWKHYCPDYEVKLWNEENFDLSLCAYISEAAEAKKWAFVSDYARFWILYNYGGLYFDTDVEIIKPLDEIIAHGPFMGTEPIGGIAPGLGMGAEAGMQVYKEILEYYSTQHYKKHDGSVNEQTIVKYTSDVFKKYGWIEHSNKEKIEENKEKGKVQEKMQCIKGIWIYPDDVFCPMNYETGRTIITENTVSIHHYAASWHSWIDDVIVNIERCKGREGLEFKIRRAVSLPFRVVNKIVKNGMKNTITFVRQKVTKSSMGGGVITRSSLYEAWTRVTYSRKQFDQLQLNPLCDASLLGGAAL